MIPATIRYVAKFDHENLGEPYTTTKPVIAWDDCGSPMVADATTGSLVLATGEPNYAGLVPAEPSIIAAVPGGGWEAEYIGGDNNGYLPVLAWLIADDGNATPIYSDSDGVPFDMTSVEGFIRIKSPDSV